MKKRVTGIGGVFFKASDPEKLRAWYGKHLGLETHPYGATFRWLDPENRDAGTLARTEWSPFAADTKYFTPSEKPFMINYRVENLEELLATLKEEGVTVVGQVESFDYGKFGWIMDPDGNKIELWEPVDDGFGEK